MTFEGEKAQFAKIKRRQPPNHIESPKICPGSFWAYGKTYKTKKEDKNFMDLSTLNINLLFGALWNSAT